MRPQDSMGALLSGEDSASGPVRSSTKLNSKYVGGKSQINLGFDSGNDVAIPVSGKTSHQTDSVAAAVFGSDNNTATARPSTKLNSFHVGGKTQISLTHEEVAPVVNSQLPTSGNSKNQSHWSFEHDQTPHLEKLHFGKRFSFPSAVQSNDELVVEQKSAVIAEEVKPKPVELAVVDSNEVPVHTSSRTGRSNLQSFSIWDTTPVEAAAVRPSSRVLKAPGGGSSFSFY